MTDKTTKSSVELSLLVPMYNESEVIDIFFARMKPVLAKCGLSYEILCVNDGSSDDTLEKLLKLQENDSSIRIINFSRNFGKEAGMTAALDHARGDAVIPIDADLQDPPELVLDFIEKWKEGYDVVYGTRACRQSDTAVKRVTSNWFYSFYNAISDLSIPQNTGDYRLMDRKVVEAIKQLPERNRFMKGLFNWVGFKQISVEYSREERAAGETKWNYWKLWNFALDGITAFSTMPLRVWSYIGSVVSLISFIYGSFLIMRTLFWGVDTPGYASTLIVVLFLGGIQLISLGVIGEYLGRLYTEVKARPVYLIEQIHEHKKKD